MRQTYTETEREREENEGINCSTVPISKYVLYKHCLYKIQTDTNTCRACVKVTSTLMTVSNTFCFVSLFLFEELFYECVCLSLADLVLLFESVLLPA